MIKNTLNIKGNVTINITLYQLPDGTLTTKLENVREYKLKNKHNK